MRHVRICRKQIHQPNNSISELLSSVIVLDSWEDKMKVCGCWEFGIIILSVDILEDRGLQSHGRFIRE